jgi:hypothetical protein
VVAEAKRTHESAGQPPALGRADSCRPAQEDAFDGTCRRILGCPVHVDADFDTEITAVDDPAFGLVNTKTDGRGRTLRRACFNVYLDQNGNGVFDFGSDPYVSGACDGDDGSQDGQLTLSQLAAGISVVEYFVPGDYVATDTVVVVEAGADPLVTIVNLRGEGGGGGS